MSSAFRGFVRKETLHLVRDARTLVILVLLPVVMVLLFGFAIRTDVTNIQVALVDPAPSDATMRLRGRLANAERFRLRAVVPSLEALGPDLTSGALQVAVVLPADAERRIARGDSLPVQVIVDGSDPNSSRLRSAYVTAVIAAWHAEALGPGARPAIRVVTRSRFNPTLASAPLFVPGLIAFVLTIVSALMTAVSITREKESGTMEMLYVSPLHPVQIVLGKVVPYVVLGFVDVVLLLVLARGIFAVPLRGSLVLLLAACLVYIVTSLALGVVIATRVATQRAAMIAALAGLLLPTLMLSGFIFPIESLPPLLQGLTRIIPARWFLAIVRAVMLKGATLADLWREALALVGITLVLLTVGIRRLAIRLG